MKGLKTCHPKILPLLHVDYFERKVLETVDAGKALCPPPFYLKAGHKISHEKSGLLTPGKNILITGDCELNTQMDLHKQTNENNPHLPFISPIYFLVTIPQLAAPKQVPLSCPISTICCSF